MKLKVFSDIHFEFHRDGGSSFLRDIGDEDAVAVVAGDVSTLRNLESCLLALCSVFKHVVFVPGNHELYGFSPADLEVCRKSIRIEGLSWLDNSIVEIDGTKFVGSTLWFPPPPPAAPKHLLNDYHQIRQFEPWVYQQHWKSLKFLDETLGNEDVLVTHHFPFSNSISARFVGGAMNAFFHAGAQAEALISKKAPKLAIHGHTHDSFDYSTGRTRVMCNPLGYPGENLSFDFHKVHEMFQT